MQCLWRLLLLCGVGVVEAINLLLHCLVLAGFGWFWLVLADFGLQRYFLQNRS